MHLLLILAASFLGRFDPLVHVGTLTEALHSPVDVAVAPDGSILITDGFYDHVAWYAADGTLQGTWPIPEGPLGIAAHPDGRFFLSLRNTGRVGIYDADFVWLGYLGDGDPLVNFVQPTDIAVSPSTGAIYVVDSGGDRLYGFHADGSLALMVGVRGGGAGEFRYPSAVAVDELNQRILVADHDNFRVQAFTTGGVFELQFGYRLKFVPGEGSFGWLPRIQGLAVDALGRIYVADALMSSVRLFDSTGTELGQLLGYGWGPGELRTPAALALSPDGSRLYVANVNANAVDVYETPSRRDAIPAADSIQGLNPSWYDVLWQSARARRGVSAPSIDVLKGGDPFARVYDGPHMVDGPVICGRCHGFPDLPGGHEGLVEGQQGLCLSCHFAGGQGLAMPMLLADVADPYGTNPAAADGRGRSHAWGVPAVSEQADSLGPATGSPMAWYLDDGRIKCSTCHNQHESFYAPYLRMSNAGDAMCKECHAPRNEGPGELGTHWVGFAYPGGTGEFPPVEELAPLFIKDGKVECLTCHGVHGADSGGANDGAGDGLLLRAAHDGTLCRTCHTEHVGHTPGGSWQPTCRDCHDAHDPQSENLALVARVVYNQTLGQDLPVVFTAHTGPGSFDDGDPEANDGICQVCHTATSYHRYDGSGTPHHDGQDCTSCHPHDSGFMPTGGDCTSCHASPQDNGDGLPPGGRRAVVGEFPVGDAHAHYGAELDSSACVVCHDMTTHMDGYVDLLDADTGALYTFVSSDDLLQDPDLSDFCASCHDADGAQRLPAPADPFGDGNAPPDVATKFQGTLQWAELYGDACFGEEGTLRAVNSHHDISDADQNFSGAKLECVNCHGAHAAGSTQPVIDPFDPLTPWSGTGNGFCLACHAGGSGPSDPGFPPGVVGPSIPLRGLESCDYQEEPWFVDYTWSHSAHGPDSKRGWEGYSGAPAYDMDCVVCHDPHGSYTPDNPAGNPYMIRDFVDGTMFVDDGYRFNQSWTGPPWETFGTARDVIVTVDGLTVDWGGPTGLCAVCHADWIDAQHYHAFCTGCQTCHGHGQAWGEYDWGPSPDDDTPCPPPLRQGDRAPGRAVPEGMDKTDVKPPLHRSQPEFQAAPAAGQGI